MTAAEMQRKIDEVQRSASLVARAARELCAALFGNDELAGSLDDINRALGAERGAQDKKT